MKNYLTILGLTACISIATAQNAKYIETMQASIAELYALESPEAHDAVINKFARIAQAEKTQWEPHYYTSLSYTFKSFGIKDSKLMDAELDKALIALRQAEQLSTNNVEIIALEGFINMLKIGVDPATRGQSLSPKIMASFGRAIGMDPNNPRATLFMAQMQIGTAQFFGTGIDEPCKLVQRAVDLFENANPTSPLAPTWGKPSAMDYLKMCEAPKN